MASEFELHTDRLGTTDEKGRRVFLHPADVKGPFRDWRSRTQWVLIFIFLILPWVRLGDRPLILLDIHAREFEIFGLSLRAHNSPLLILVLAAAAFGLFFVTSIFGRIWCGWACPQTVFIDGVFRKIERWIEGPALERRKLDRMPWSMEKLAKRTAKWSAFLIVSLILTHSFLAYFVGTEKLAEMIQSSPRKNWGDFLFMSFTTAIILFDFAWFREQFCTIVCPYGRFQSVLMDKSSLVVSYDGNRGEPRATPQAKTLAKNHGGKLGDCVNCYRCVQVCPTGIDIRRGVQMECIACTACVDACDEVMDKIKKPKGLIKYDAIAPSKKRRFNARAATYLALCVGSLVALFTFARNTQTVEFDILRAKDTPYTTAMNVDGTPITINHFRIDLTNQNDQVRELEFGLVKSASGDATLITAVQPFPMRKQSSGQADIFIRFPKSNLIQGQAKIKIFIRDAKPLPGEKPFYAEKEVTLLGPFS